MPQPINKQIVTLSEKTIEQQMVGAKVPISESSRMHDKITPIPDYVIPQTRPRDDSGSRKNIQDNSREILRYPDPIYRSLLNHQKYPYKKFCYIIFF